VQLQLEPFPITVPGHVDEPHAGFDQPASDQGRLPEDGIRVAFTELRINLLQIERRAYFGRRQQTPGPLFLTVESAKLADLFGPETLGVDLLQK
jgi:hypothetical protein